MEIRVKPFIVSPECEQRQLILLFLSNLLRAESDQKIVCANATSLNQLSNWEIATLIFGACIIISIMFASLCCIFFWWQKKKANRRNKRESTGYQLSSTPVIRSDDVISFVLPSQSNSMSTEQHQNNPDNHKTSNDSSLVQPPASTVASNRSSTSLGDLNSQFIKKLNKQLYSPGQETNEDVYTGRPKIGVSMQYDSDRNFMNLKVLGALNLPFRNTEKQTPPDPYVKLTILADRPIKLTTKTLRSTCNPLFNQSFELDMTNINIYDVQVSLMVRDRPDLSRYVQNQYESTRSGRLRSVTLGQAVINLLERNTTDKRQVRWCFLEEPSPLSSDFTDMAIKGEILVSISYEKNHGRLTLEIDRVRQLLFQGEKDSDKLMVKISLMERGAVVAKRRTKCVRRENAAALFEEKFIFSIQPKSLFSDESSCLIQLFSRTRIGTKKCLGKMSFQQHDMIWHDIAHRPGCCIIRWYPLT